ncbi:MAG: GGDEF domain-containing protein [Planctomycetota bacterium]
MFGSKLPCKRGSVRALESLGKRAFESGGRVAKIPLSQDTVIARGGSVPDKLLATGKSCLVRIYPAGAGQGLFELPPQRIIIGRGSDCDVTILDTSASRQHAYIEQRAGTFMIADMESTNGTFVNDMRVDKRLLEAGDLIRIGSHILKFLSSDHIEAQYHETIYSMMIADGLTGAYNKRYLMETLERELVRSFRHSRPLAMVMLDVDFFKSVNDTHGHLAGDAVLREIASRIRDNVRRDEVFARYGGEEFVVLLPEASVEECRAFAERLRQVVGDSPVLVDEKSISVTISLGIAHTDGKEELLPDDLIQEADRNLYSAKRNGRNQVV